MPNYCEYMKYLKYFLSKTLYFTPRYSEHLCKVVTKHVSCEFH